MEEPWRYRCPNGHASWRSRSDYLECKICGIRFPRDDLVDMTEVETPDVEFGN